MNREPGELRDLLQAPDAPERSARPVQGGPIAVLPEPTALFADAVRAAGGTVAPLGAETRGIVWLAEKDEAGLVDALDRYPAIGWVQLPWAGVDAFADVLASHAGRKSPVWTSAKGAYSEPVAEHAIALALALMRRLPQKARTTSWAPAKLGDSLFGRRVVVVGAGGVALEIIRLLSVFDVDVTVVRRSPGTVPGARRTVTTEALLDVLPDVDVVIVAAASTSDTARLFDAEAFAAMPDSAILVNIARGSLVDSDALVAALESGAIAGAGLDVTDPEPLPTGHPLWSAPNCVITSHSADTPEMVAPLLASRVRANVEAFLGDGRFVGVVDPGAGY